MKSRKQGRAYFVPVEYQLDFLLNNVKLWMCVNEQNVVDKQNGVEENCKKIIPLFLFFCRLFYCSLS